VDGDPHTGNTVHTGIAVFPDPGEQKSRRRRGDGPAAGLQSRLQVRARRDTGKTKSLYYIILCYIVGVHVRPFHLSGRIHITVLNSNERLRPPKRVRF